MAGTVTTGYSDKTLVIITASYLTVGSDTLTLSAYRMDGTLISTNPIAGTGQQQLNVTGTTPTAVQLWQNSLYVSRFSAFGFLDSRDVTSLVAYLIANKNFNLPLVFPAGSTSTINA
jgi:hypothetical protein